MYLPLIGFGPEWAAWITTILGWLFLASLTILTLASTDNKVDKK